MAQDRTDPSGQTPEANLLEQQLPLETWPLTGSKTLRPGTATPSHGPADGHRLTSHQAAPAGGDDNPPALAGVGWS